MFDIPFTEIGRGLGLAAPVLAATAGYLRGPSARRKKIARNVELYESLPDSSRAKGVVGDWLDNQVENLRNFENEAKRDSSSMIASGVITGGFAALALFLVSLGEWWWYLASILPWLCVVVGANQTFQAAQLAKRDEKGNKIPD